MYASVFFVSLVDPDLGIVKRLSFVLQKAYKIFKVSARRKIAVLHLLVTSITGELRFTGVDC